MHGTVPVVSQCHENIDYALRMFGNQSPNLLEEIVKPSCSITQACFKSVLKFFLVYDEDITFHECCYVSRHHRCSSVYQQHKYNGFQESRVKDIVKSAIGDVVNQVPMNLPIQEYIKFFMERDIKINGNDITVKSTINNSRR